MKSLQPQCRWCGVSCPGVELLTCSRCQVAQYCSPDHQAVDFESHVALCKSVKTTREMLAREQHKLRKGPARDARTTHVGRFQELPETFALLDAKRAHIQSLATIGSPIAIKLALREALDSLRLNPQDTQRVADGVPLLMLLLGRTQDAYDFIKSWTGVCDSYGHRDMTQSYHEIHGADLTESIDGFRHCKTPFTAFGLAALTWIKLQAARQIGDVIRSRMVVDHVSLPSLASLTICDLLWGARSESSHDQLRDLHYWKKVRESLVLQAMELVELTHKANVAYWQAMLDPVSFLHAHPFDRLRCYRQLLQPWLLPSEQLWRISSVFIESQLCAIGAQGK